MNKTKIGIMTFYAVQNNGAALQAFALQQSLKKLGAEPELIRYFDRHNESVAVKETRWAKLVRNPKIIVGILFHPVRYRKLRGKSQENAQAYNKFRQKYLNVSVEPYYEYEDLYEANKLYQGFIAGSDMVWTPIGQNLTAYFLQFADKEKRFSYSPSLTGCVSFSKENIHIINEYLQGMTMISCREQEGVDFIKKNVGLDAVLTLDPTLLFNKEEWRKELSIESTKPNKPYILCYVFGGLPRHIAKEVNRIAEKYKMDVRLIPLLTKEYKFELDNDHNGPYGLVNL